MKSQFKAQETFQWDLKTYPFIAITIRLNGFANAIDPQNNVEKRR